VWAAGPQGFLQEYIDCDDFKCCSTSISKGRRSIGFLKEDTESSSYVAMKSLVMEELKAFFRPELLNRIDEMVVFRPLEKTQVCFFYVLL